MRMKTLACCRRRPQDFSIDMDQEPDSKPLISFLHPLFLQRFVWFWPDFGLFLCVLEPNLDSLYPMYLRLCSL